jgi:hypothetical protein
MICGWTGGRDDARANHRPLQNYRLSQLQAMLPTTATSRTAVSQACHRFLFQISGQFMQVFEIGWRLVWSSV